MKRSFLLIFLVFIQIAAFAQSKAEADFVRAVNPRFLRNATFKALSATAEPITMAVPFGILAVSLINDDKKNEMNAYELGAGIAITAVATEALKVLVKRQRPYVTYDGIYPDELDDGYSFPSAHTSLAFSTATSLALVYKKWYISVPAFMWAASVGYSRMYLGQHYPSDVFAGALVGIAGAYTSNWLNKKFFSKKKKPLLP